MDEDTNNKKMSDVDQIKKGQRNEVRLTTQLLIFTVMQTLTAVWWAASITSEQAHLAEAVTKSVTSAEAANLQLQITRNSQDVGEIKTLLIRIEDKIDELK